MASFKNEKNAAIVYGVIEAIHQNAEYLSKIDGQTGDGDHGINMNKGFLLAKERINLEDSYTEALKKLGRTLVMDIGGSMGPIYGTFFNRLSKVSKGYDEIDEKVFSQSLQEATQGLMDLAGAKPGDKTLVDTLLPASEAFEKAINEGKSFQRALTEMSEAAEKGKESTKAMVAKIGRAARLGERSKGHLDAGATSCCIILQALAQQISSRL